MATENRRHATNCAAVLGLLTLLLTPIVAQDRGGSSPSADNDDSYESYSPPMATVLVVIIALFLTVGFLSIFFRHFAWCLGLDFGHRAATEGWRRQAARGLDSSVLDSFPRFLYSDVKVHRIGKGTLECAVCLSEFSDDEVLQMLPVCSHVFHPNCIAPWLASHVTCPVCRANLEFHQRRNHYDSLVQQLQQQLSNGESEPSDQNQTHPDNNHADDAGVVSVQPSPSPPIKPLVREIHDGGERRGKLPRSHSTGHSLVGDCERFTLRLPEEVRNKLVNANNHSMLVPAMISPTIGYRSRTVGCGGFPVKPDRWRLSASPPFISRPGSPWSPPKSHADTECTHNNSTGPMKSILKSIKSPLNRQVRCSDIGERSSDKLCPNRQPQDLESGGQQ